MRLGAGMRASSTCSDGFVRATPEHRRQHQQQQRRRQQYEVLWQQQQARRLFGGLQHPRQKATKDGAG